MELQKSVDGECEPPVTKKVENKKSLKENARILCFHWSTETYNRSWTKVRIELMAA